MKIFATRVWGYDPTRWPLITFSNDGNRDNLLRKSKAGDIVVFVGTQNEPTQLYERGGLLGIAQFSRSPIDTLSVLDKENISPHDYDDKGQFRWPKALLMTRAWRFSGKPLPQLREVFENQLPYNATVQAVELSETDIKAVKELPAKEVELPETRTSRAYRKQEETLARNSPTTGPIPSAWESTVKNNPETEAVTYVLRFGKTDCWKIGWADNLDKRLRQVNKHIPVEICNSQWNCAWKQQWPNRKSAYDMEQSLLRGLQRHRTIGERILCCEDDIQNIWIQTVVGKS